MGGKKEQIEVVPLSPLEGGPISGHGSETMSALRGFEVSRTECFDPADKDKLLTAVEAAFGQHQIFDALVRKTLIDATELPSPTHSLTV